MGRRTSNAPSHRGPDTQSRRGNGRHAGASHSPFFTVLKNQRWRNRRSTYRVPEEVIRTQDYEIVPMHTEVEVRELIATHHYLHSLPPPRCRFGLYRHAELVGAAVFSYPTNDRSITNVFGCGALAGVELGRQTGTVNSGEIQHVT